MTGKIPKFLEHLPLFAGFPVPYTVLWFNGKPDFRVPDPQKVAEVMHHKLCGICGRRLGEYVYLIGGPRTAESRLFTDPPMHEKCAQFSMQTCPFLTGQRETYSSRPVPANAGVSVSDLVADTRPEVMYIFKAPLKSVEMVAAFGDYFITAKFVGKRAYK